MRIYLASAFSRWAEMNEYADALEQVGILVASTWHRSAADGTDESPTDASLNYEPERWARYATKDLAEVAACDVLALFTGAGRGGRHVETGAALALGKRLHVIGVREHIFHGLAEVVAADADEWLRHLSERAA